MPKQSPKATNRTKATNYDYSSPESHETPVKSVLPPHGGYENLLSFQKARIVYDGTVRFCERFVDKRSRTHDQMTQAARSGKQNIVEASQASGTSKGLLQRPTVATVIIGARNEEQLRQNREAVGLNLTSEQVAKLDAASARTPIYPHWHQKGFEERNPFPTP
jgi:Aldo/keto reductase family